MYNQKACECLKIKTGVVVVKECLYNNKENNNEENKNLNNNNSNTNLTQSSSTTMQQLDSDSNINVEPSSERLKAHHEETTVMASDPTGSDPSVSAPTG